MLPGPVFNVELITTARRPRYYVLRVLYGLALLILIWQNYAGWSRSGDGVFSPQQMTVFASTTFSSFVVLQAVMVLALTPSLVSGVIANEKQRKTLHYLLASQLSSGEIVLGKLLARMLHVTVFVAVGLPIISLLSLFGGVDPLLVGLTTAGTLTTAFFLASLSILCSTVAKRVREAIPAAYLLEFAWLVLPGVISASMPTTYPAAYELIRPINDWVKASLPWSPIFNFMGGMTARSAQQLLTDSFWMMGLQVGAGLVFSGLAVWRLRPVFQSQEGSTGIRILGMQFGTGTKGGRWRWFRRRPVGDSAMIWKELHTSRTGGVAQVIGGLISAVVVGTVAYWTYLYGIDAFRELQSSSYTARGTNRGDFNGFLRALSVMIEILTILAATLSGANSMTSEREDDTWISLVSTPLEAGEIVWPKILGVIWRVRWPVFLLALLWAAGMATGALHPVGVLFEIIELAVFLTFGATLGTFFSIRSKSTWKAQATTIAIMVIANGGYMMCLCPLVFGNGTAIILAGCTPFIMATSLLAPWEYAEIFQNQPSNFGPTRETGQMVAACIIGVIGYGVAAALLAMGTIASFEKASDRPRRDEFEQPPPPPKQTDSIKLESSDVHSE